MVARGASIDEIAAVLGYGRAMAAKDVQECLRIWQVAHLEESEKWRPLILQRHEMLFREAFTAWEASKTNGRPNAKFIDSASRSLETLLDACAKDGYRVQDLLVALVQSRIFTGRG